MSKSYNSGDILNHLTRERLLELESKPRTPIRLFCDYLICFMPVIFGFLALAEYLYVPNLAGNSTTSTYTYFIIVLIVIVGLAFVISIFSRKFFYLLRHKAPFYSFVFVLFAAYDYLTLKTGTLVLPYFPWTDQILNAIIRSITFDDDFKDETCCIYAISKNIVENSPITARKLTQAHENARKWIMANREEAIKLMLENKWASGQFDKVLAFYNTLDYSVSDKTTEETLIKVIDDYKTCGILNKDFDTMETLNRVWDGVLMNK